MKTEREDLVKDLQLIKKHLNKVIKSINGLDDDVKGSKRLEIIYSLFKACDLLGDTELGIYEYLKRRQK